MSFGRVVLALLSKDLRLEARSRHGLNVLLPFAGATLVVFGLALGPGRLPLQRDAPALLWITSLFAAVLGARSSYELEDEDGALTGLLLAPIDKGAVFLGKALALGTMLALLQVVTAFLATVLFGIALRGGPLIPLASFALGSLGLAAATSLFAALVVDGRSREALLPLLVLPVVVPVSLAGVRATTLSLRGEAASAGSWLGLLVAFDAVFLAAGVLLFEWILED